jgi:copper chaperone CopZ
VEKLRLSLLCVLPALLLGIGLAACGGGESEEDKVVEAVETSATSTDPADCKRLATVNFLEETQISEGVDAARNCEEEVEEGETRPESVDVANVKIQGSKATADVAFDGGTFDGQTLAIALVEESGNWKLDRIEGFANFDQAEFARNFRKSLESGPTPIAPGPAACVGRVLAEIPQSKVEKRIFTGEAVAVEKMLLRCEG